jgi:nitrite reductase/ring-hydroxylating ferredoxin subunit
MSSDCVRVGGTSEIPVGTMKKEEVEGTEILMANVNGDYYIIGNTCPHMGTALSQGVLGRNIVTGYGHKEQFSVTTGKVVLRPKVGFFHTKIQDAPSYHVEVENENIVVKL